MTDRTAVLASVAQLLDSGDTSSAAAVIRRDYAFEPIEAIERKYGALQATRVYVRDGFIDRYSGTRLIFPGVLRLLSLHLPTDFPFHPNWKMSETHEAYWELSATVDHVVPVTRGGANSEENWVTTSMRRNSAKANWTLEELGWTLLPPGRLDDWDGLLSWFRNHLHRNQQFLANSHVRRWHRAAIAVAAR